MKEHLSFWARVQMQRRYHPNEHVNDSIRRLVSSIYRDSSFTNLPELINKYWPRMSHPVVRSEERVLDLKFALGPVRWSHMFLMPSSYKDNNILRRDWRLMITPFTPTPFLWLACVRLTLHTMYDCTSQSTRLTKTDFVQARFLLEQFHEIMREVPE